MNPSRSKEGATTAKGLNDTWHPETCFRCMTECPTIMRLTLLMVVLLSVLTTGRAVTVQKVIAPSVVDPKSDKVVLTCVYNLSHSEQLYSVSWYKHEAMFYRYKMDTNPRGQTFLKGIKANVNVEQSDSKKLVLLGDPNYRDNREYFEGRYTCEVLIEHQFKASFAEANVTVAILPKRQPQIEGLKPYYEVGDYLKAKCTSAPSFPFAEITFLINGKSVDESFTKKLPSNEYNSVEFGGISRSELSLRLDRHHFPSGNLNITCLSFLPGISGTPALKAEKSITLAANNQRLAQEPPRSSSGMPLSTIALSTCSVLISLLISRGTFLERM